jgi:hypothetical protein
VEAAGLSVGTYTGTITIADANAANSPLTVEAALHIYNTGKTSEPFGIFATPIDGSTVSGSIPVTGWALDDIGIVSVQISRKAGKSSVYIGDAVFVEGARPDVEQAYPGYPMNYKAGWGYMLLTNFLPNGGNGTFTLYATATDVEGHQVSLGSKTIICDNANAVKPFGALDTPLQGGSTAAIETFGSFGSGSGIDYLAEAPVDYFSAVGISKDYQENRPLHRVVPDDCGDITIEIKETQRLEIHLQEIDEPAVDKENTGRSNWRGYQVIGNNLKKLPVGTTFNKRRGIFYWQPGPGFIGEYRFVFFQSDPGGKINKRNIVIRILY